MKTQAGGRVALFFDQDWFRARLAEAGQTHDALAAAAGLTLEELAAVWKDQMEVTSRMVEGFADVLKADADEVASRCGVSTPDVAPRVGDPAEPGTGRPGEGAMFAEILTRLDRLERDVAELRKQVAQVIEKNPAGDK